jgi:DNA-binding GntR family transcriptional regulator
MLNPPKELTKRQFRINPDQLQEGGKSLLSTGNIALREDLTLPTSLKPPPGYTNPLEQASLSMQTDRQASQPNSKPTEDFIYTELYNAILERRLAPETKLGENLLAAHYSVSRTIIRQVLQRLSHDRLVKLEPNRGAFVAVLSLEEAKQIYEAWRLTEAAIIRSVTQSITSEEVADLRSLIAQEREACHQKDLARLARLSVQFHLQLAELCPNQFLGRFLKELVPQTSLAFFYEVRNMPICGEDEHSKILDYIAAGEAESAVTAAINHLNGIESALNARAQIQRNTSIAEILETRILSRS